MSIAFLNPWFWLGAASIAAPLWLHLRRRTETRLVKFSALRFLDDQPLPRASPLRLRNLLLFLLRVAALLLLVAAFAWPYDPAAGELAITESRVYVIDNTLSHQADDAFARARERIAGDLDGLGREVQAAVIELTSQPRLVSALGDDRVEAARKVRALQPSFQRGSYLDAFRQASTLLANSLGGRRRILFFTDSQENQWTEHADSPPFLREVEAALSRPAAEPAGNLSLAEPQTQRIFLGDKSLAAFSVRLTHYGPARTATVVVRSNDQVIFNRSVDLEQKPGSILLQAQWEADPQLWLRCEAVVDGAPDALPGDNRVFFSVPPVKEGAVALLAQSPYLRLALSPDIMRGQWAARVLDPSRLAEEVAANRDAEVLVIESRHLQSPDARTLLSRYLSNGRGVLLFVDKLTPVVSGALRNLGFEPAAGADQEIRRPSKVQYVFSNHPVFHPFLSPDYGSLAEVGILRHARIRTTQGMPLLLSDAGEALFFQGTGHAGKLFVATFGLERDQTNWPVQLTFIPFLDLCLQNARREDPSPSNFEPGEIATVSFPADAAGDVVLHDGRAELQRAALVKGKAQLQMPPQPGLYAVHLGDAKEPAKIFSVNPSPKESELKALEDPAVLKSWQLDPADRPAPPAASRTGELPSLPAILRQGLWWPLLVAGGAALLLETIWTAMRKETV